jgi:hypothetical protein
MNTMEQWKDIEGYEGLYQVSNEGRVKSLHREIIYKDGRKKVLEEKILHNFLSDLGYCHVMLSKDGVPNRYKVHRLVAKAFIPNPMNLPIINHKDECKTNNSVVNLEWCDQNYNIHYGTMIERGREKQLNREDKSKQLDKIDKITGEVLESFKSASEVERKYSQFKATSVSRCCRGGQYLNGKWQTITEYKDFMWKYKKADYYH